MPLKNKTKSSEMSSESTSKHVVPEGNAGSKDLVPAVGSGHDDASRRPWTPSPLHSHQEGSVSTLKGWIQWQGPRRSLYLEYNTVFTKMNSALVAVLWTSGIHLLVLSREYKFHTRNFFPGVDVFLRPCIHPWAPSVWGLGGLHFLLVVLGVF